MSRPLKHSAPISINMRPLERLLIAYFASRYANTKSAIVRGMIQRYSRADQSLDVERFMDFARSSFVPPETKTDEEAAAILEAAGEFAAVNRDGSAPSSGG